MSEVKIILQLIEQGISHREVSRSIQINRKTVSQYFSKNKELNLTKENLQTIPDEELEALFKSVASYFDSSEEYKYLVKLFPYFERTQENRNYQVYSMGGIS